MELADWIVFSLYLLLTVAVGVFVGRLVKSSGDLFAAGGQSPWWTSGLSAFMTMFSANTFVVWGGIAYQYGSVAIFINLCYGVAAILAGYTVAGRWKRMGINTPAEYIDQRFGKAALQFYTWAMMIFRIVGVAGALYAIALLVMKVIMVSTPGWDFDPANINYTALNIAILVFALIVIGYTMIGGLWAVLMTDTLQFIILNLAVIFIVPLILFDVGGFSAVFSDSPEGFLSITSGSYTWFFLLGWVLIHYFMIGAEWAFVQRFICVPTPKDARKSTLLFGGLYLFSPFLWLLPPLLWRLKKPIPEGASEATITALKETAYIDACLHVLPVGMVGLMLAALFSATASMISSQLNVFSGVLTNDIYRRLFRPEASEKQLLRMGRIFTLLLGLLLAAVASLVPTLGGAEKVIVKITQLMVVPLLAPTLFSIFFKGVRANAIWLSVGICFPLGLLNAIPDFVAIFEKWNVSEALYGWMKSSHAGFASLLESVGMTSSNYMTLVGTILPILIVAAVGMRGGRESFQGENAEEEEVPLKANPMPGLIVGYSMMASAVTLVVLSLLPANAGQRTYTLLFGLAVLGLSFLVLRMAKGAKKVS